MCRRTARVYMQTAVYMTQICKYKCCACRYVATIVFSIKLVKSVVILTDKAIEGTGNFSN